MTKDDDASVTQPSKRKLTGGEDPPDENSKVSAQLQELMATARDNEEKSRRLHEIELQLVGAPTLKKFLETLFFGYRGIFGLDAVSLVLIDEEYVFQRILEAENVGLKLRQRLVFLTGKEEISEIGIMGSPWLGPYRQEDHEWLFPNALELSASLAVLPLIHKDEVIGLLSFASYNREHFQEGQGTELLERLAAIVTICVVNNLNAQCARLRTFYDPISGVHNRSFFEHRLIEEVTRLQRQGSVLSCLVIDIDDFRSLNDKYGHKAGDKILHEAAVLIAEQDRFHDVMARYQSEQFVLLLGDTDSAKGAVVAERIRSVLEGHEFELGTGDCVRVTVSIGVATLTPLADTTAFRGGDGDLLVDGASRAMSMAKEQGRNRVVCAGVLER